jgi:hypothetical protein
MCTDALARAKRRLAALQNEADHHTVMAAACTSCRAPIGQPCHKVLYRPGGVRTRPHAERRAASDAVAAIETT